MEVFGVTTAGVLFAMVLGIVGGLLAVALLIARERGAAVYLGRVAVYDLRTGKRHSRPGKPTARGIQRYARSLTRAR